MSSALLHKPTCASLEGEGDLCSCGYARSLEKEMFYPDIREALRDFFAPSPPVGCGNGRDDHECTRCHETYRAHDAWGLRKEHAERRLKRFMEGK